MMRVYDLRNPIFTSFHLALLCKVQICFLQLSKQNKELYWSMWMYLTFDVKVTGTWSSPYVAVGTSTTSSQHEFGQFSRNKQLFDERGRWKMMRYTWHDLLGLLCPITHGLRNNAFEL